MKKPTIKDVAKLAGVSFKTVSRVINNEPVVSDDVKERVLRHIKALNYQPNMPARLMRRAPFSIAFVYDNPNSHYVIEMQNGILAECRAQGFELVIHPTVADSVAVGTELMTMIGSSQIGGIILTPPLSENLELVKYLVGFNAKVVRILSGSREPDNLTPVVYIDDRKAGEDITQYLIDLGHKKIAFLGGQPNHESNKGRRAGYEAALQKNNIALNNELVLDGEFTFESGVEMTEQVLQQKERPTAIFAANDEIAAGTLFSARMQSISVPHELSIAGFEDSPFSRQTWPKLTTVHQPNLKIAQCAAALLIESMLGTGTAEKYANGFRLEIVVRDSTAALEI